MTIRLSAVDEKATLEDISPQPALSTFAQNWRMPAKKDNSSNVGTGQTLLFWREGKDGAIHATVKGKEVKEHTLCRSHHSITSRAKSQPQAKLGNASTAGSDDTLTPQRKLAVSIVSQMNISSSDVA